ncbi:MAG: cupredoxin domain-containing protein [Candidatus Aenigmarchaeota archaeon]|nr:cupredoxin domain-containing protein [Candidatus Aenigmarchaeota archaeon]
MNKLVPTLPLIFLVVLAGCTSKSSTSGTPTGKEYQVDMTSAGFSPKQPSIKAGDTVVFVNKDASSHWPASDIHPAHNVYPEKGGCIGSKFDACKGLKQGENYSFAFFQKGSWCYHDHLNPNLKGCVDVQ